MPILGHVTNDLGYDGRNFINIRTVGLALVQRLRRWAKPH